MIGFTHITVKNVVRELEDNGLADIEENPLDRRSKHISLSDKGRELLPRLQALWRPFGATLKRVMDYGHPDILSILGRIEGDLNKHPINEMVGHLDELEEVYVLDYKPSLKSDFYELAGNWLLGVLKGTLEEEDKFTLHNPDKAYLEAGGFVFFARHLGKTVGCVALKRLDEDSFEFAKLFIDQSARKLGIATKLIERCISRCRENQAKQLWLQTTMSMPEAHRLYYKLGFQDRQAPPQMAVLKRTEKIMCIDL